MSLRADFKAGARSLLKTPATSLLVTLALGIGIGSTTAVFSVVDAVLFRALPVHEPERLVRISSTTERRGSDQGRVSLSSYRALREQTRSLAGLALYREGVMVHLATGRDRAFAAHATLVTGDYFGVVGLRPAAGRLLGPADDAIEGGHAVVVLSHAFWRSRYAGSEEAMGQSLRINGRPYQIVGVTSRGFHGVGQQTATDVFLSLSMASEAEPVYRGQLGFASSAFFEAVGRLGACREKPNRALGNEASWSQ